MKVWTQHSGSSTKLKWFPFGRHFSYNPLHSYLNECQKNEICTIIDYLAIGYEWYPPENTSIDQSGSHWQWKFTSDIIIAKSTRECWRFNRQRHQNIIYIGLRESDVSNLVQGSVYHKISTWLKTILRKWKDINL